uniref:RING-type E3 ubiquitin transferase n=1 Tax=Oryza punctata TaxID=4537 RepID=A0A0E0KDI5_ORYPU
MVARRRLVTSDTASPPTAAGTATQAPPHLSRRDLHELGMKVAIAGNVVVAALFFAVIIWRLFFFGSKDRADGTEADADAGASSTGAGSSPCASPGRAGGGLGKEDLMALPVYVHGASADGGAAVRAKAEECAVCIGELRDGDAGRLLPRCGHHFHAECVDMWFRSHATCPLCRGAAAAAVAADGDSGEADPKVDV